MRLGPRDLLEYAATYKVLICRECHYAIQKNAIRSHLLRHKIYREERRRLLFTLNELDIVEPDEVPLPSPSTSPVDALPTVSGYCCTVAGCRHLCASSKRMRRHWSDAHSLNISVDLASLARPVKLQTFFRGTKLKYFEVSTRISAAEPSNDGNEGGFGRQGFGVDTVLSSAQPSPWDTPIVVDLETLAYFHHFTTTTCATLPTAEDSLPSSQYWETNVISLALQRQWMMCGLLAISAYHSATLATETTTQRMHTEQAAKFGSLFLVQFEGMTNDNLRMATNYKEEAKASVQIRSILTCAQWASSGLIMRQDTILGSEAAFIELQSIIEAIQNFDFQSANSSGLEQSTDEPSRQPSARMNRITSSRGSLKTNHIPPRLLNHLHMLPYRMAEIFGKPDHEEDALVILLTIATLVECCTSSFISDDASRAWQNMVQLLNKTTDHFHHMVALQNPAALVVLAHWAAISVKRAENCGCWFIHGLSRAIMFNIQDILSTDDAAQALVAELE
ncbi:hypothetical protein N7526_006891 [Penicillium atrosanguineum]|nr:hypothetical protein N7526_006891 [Penicillium atrosanguineum]